MSDTMRIITGLEGLQGGMHHCPDQVLKVTKPALMCATMVTMVPVITLLAMNLLSWRDEQKCLMKINTRPNVLLNVTYNE